MTAMAQDAKTPEGIRLVLAELLELDSTVASLLGAGREHQQAIAALEQETKRSGVSHLHNIGCPECLNLSADTRAGVLAELDQAATREGLDSERDALVGSMTRLMEGSAPLAREGLTVTDGRP